MTRTMEAERLRMWLEAIPRASWNHMLRPNPAMPGCIRQHARMRAAFPIFLGRSAVRHHVVSAEARDVLHDLAVRTSAAETTLPPRIEDLWSSGLHLQAKPS